MSHFKDFEKFIYESNTIVKPIKEGTVEGYRYRFTLDGVKYFIDQGKDDKSIFGIKDKKKGGWKVMTKGDLFNPEIYDMDRNSFVEFIQKGIKYFNIRADVDVNVVKESEWSKFFSFEIEKKPGRLTKKYVIMKLQCGKAAAKWHTR